jgi:O-antigen polymerase
MSAKSLDVIPVPAGGARSASLPAMLVATFLGLVLQWTIARVYSGLIVESFGGAREEGVTAGLAIPLSYLLTAIATFACAGYCEKRRGASRVIVVIHLVAVIIPLQALVATQFELARLAFAAGVTVAYLGTIVVAGLLPEIRVPPPSPRARALLLILALFLSMYVLGSLLRSGGVHRLNFDLTEVYKVREEYVERLGPLIGYLVPWQGYVLNPALMLIAVRRRSLLLGLIGLVLQAMLFGMTGYRAFLLNPALLLIFYLVGWRRQLTSLALGGMLAVVGIALALYAWLDAPVIPALLVDRVIVVPAEIHYWYYDFFGVHGQAPLRLSQSILAALTPSHYNVPIAEVIAWTYMDTAASANVGLFGDAYANFGFAGCAIYALLFAVLLKTLDAAGRACNPRIAAALLAMPAFALVNSGLLTTLLTHGLGLTVVVLWALTPSAPSRTAEAAA